jgi:anaerobic magnesium-protoporphyrin IX monomethyl ester cyclase
LKKSQIFSTLQAQVRNKHTDMMVKLFFPPHFAIQQPYLSLPALTAFLRERGVHVSQEDLNIASFFYFMQPAYLENCAGQLEQSLKAYESNRFQMASSFHHYLAVRRALLAVPLVVQNIGGAIDFFRRVDGFLDFEQYALNEQIIKQAFNIISAIYYPTSVSLVDFVMQHSPEASGDIFAAVQDKTQNPYLPFLQAYVAEGLKSEAPDLVGISLTALSQVIPGLTLAHLIRTTMPNTKIVIGGVIPNHLADKIKKLPQLFTLFDYLVRYEGETPLLRLCQSLKGQLPIEQVPNLLYFEKGQVKDTGLVSFENVNELPTPDYRGLPLEQYLSPLPVLSLEPGRGCYWRKCTFCNQYSVHENTFRVRQPGKTARDVAQLNERYGVRLFNIVNEGLPAKHLSKLAEAILDHRLDVRWYAGARLEKFFTRDRLDVLGRSGCRKLFFGLESGSQRLQDVMAKGIHLEDVPNILTYCNDAGVDVHLYIMVGFPTETKEEICETQEFIVRNLDKVDKEWFSFYISVFIAMISSPIFEQLPRIGYRLVSKGPQYDLEYLFEHEPLDSTTFHIPRLQREEITKQMADSIYKHLPPQHIPEEVTHYMCYRWLSERSGCKPTPKYTTQRNDSATLQHNGYRFRNSPWVTVRKFKAIGNGPELTKGDSIRLKYQHVAFDLKRGKSYILNESSAKILEDLRSPRQFCELLSVLQGSRPDTDRLQRFLTHLLERGLIHTVEAHDEAK